MTAIPFPLGSFPGSKPHESAGRLVNALAEPLGPGAPASAVIKRTPGLKAFTSATTDQGTELTGYRGAILIGNNLFAAFEDILVYTTSAGGVPIEVGALSGTEPVSFSRNNKSPTPEGVVVTETAAYTFDTTTITEITDEHLPTVTSTTFQDGYTFYGSDAGQLIASGINDASNINALDVVQLEARPDGGVRAVSYDQYLYGFGRTSIEVFSNTPNPTGFPFSRIAVISRGLASFRAVAGFEDGFGKALVWVGDDNAVHTLSGGFQPVRISTPDVDRAIEAVADKSELEVMVCIAGGHPLAAVSSNDWTWEFNLATQRWHERESYLFDRWRASGNSVFAFGRWICGDRLSGRLLEISGSAYDEVGDPLIWRVESAPAQAFPRGLLVPRADFSFAPGTGVANGEQPMQTDPQVGISWSDDGGLTWGNPLLRELGPQGEAPVIQVNRTGRTGRQGRRWRLEVADAVYVGFMGGDMIVETVRR